MRQRFDRVRGTEAAFGPLGIASELHPLVELDQAPLRSAFAEAFWCFAKSWPGGPRRASFGPDCRGSVPREISR